MLYLSKILVLRTFFLISALHNVYFSLQYETQLVTWWASTFSVPPNKDAISS